MTQEQTDRELLELAAKAVGLQVGYWVGESMQQHFFDQEQGAMDVAWNPLEDDGDALRLAVKLGLSIHIGAIHVSVEFNGTWIEETSTSDIYAATRRAIVRAAATIGRDMK